MNGVLLIDKPSGPTSFDAVRAVRRALNVRKVGHAGTLDPLASGLLVIGIGQGTKLVPFLIEGEKRYLAQVALGAKTDTDDALGEVIGREPVPKFGNAELDAVLSGFIGRIQQVPPVYSAIKQNGVPVYRKARGGEEVSLEAREVDIFSIEIIEFRAEWFSIDVRCGPGTYIRSLARDAAKSLGTLGHLTGLRRVETSGFSVDEAMTPEGMEEAAGKGRLEDLVIPMAEALRKLAKVEIEEEAIDSISKGRALSLENLSAAREVPIKANVSLLDKHGNLVSIARRENDVLQPVRVFV